MTRTPVILSVKQHARPNSRPDMGFTMLEMLIVAAIMSILIGLTWYGVATYLSRAKKQETQLRLRNAMLLVEEFYSVTGKWPLVAGNPNDCGPIPPELADGGLSSPIPTVNGAAQSGEKLATYIKNNPTAGAMRDKLNGPHVVQTPSGTVVFVDGWYRTGKDSLASPASEDSPYLLRYVTYSDGSGTLKKAHARPFFVSSGLDRKWGTDDDMYSFELGLTP